MCSCGSCVRIQIHAYESICVVPPGPRVRGLLCPRTCFCVVACIVRVHAECMQVYGVCIVINYVFFSCTQMLHEENLSTWVHICISFRNMSICTCYLIISLYHVLYVVCIYIYVYYIYSMCVCVDREMRQLRPGWQGDRSRWIRWISWISWVRAPHFESHVVMLS